MSILRLPLHFVGSKGEKKLYTLFDSAANLSCIHPDLLNDLETPVQFREPRKVLTATEGAYIDIREALRLEFYINDVSLSDDFLVVPGLTEEVIIGAATMQKWRIKLDFDKEIVIIDPRVQRWQIGRLIG